MDTKLKEVTQAMIDALQKATVMDGFIDATDADPTTGVGIAGAPSGSPTACQFTMTKNVDKQVPGRCPHPLGFIQYTVTVKAEWVPFDD